MIKAIQVRYFRNFPRNTDNWQKGKGVVSNKFLCKIETVEKCEIKLNKNSVKLLASFPKNGDTVFPLLCDQKMILLG